MFNKIIVPLDGSSTAEAALPYAEEMAARLGSELVLLFVKEHHDYYSNNIFQAYLDYMTQKAMVAMMPYLKDRENQQVNISNKVMTGNPAEEIIKFAESVKNSQIIMATHGQSGLSIRFPLGSVADKVVRGTTRPVGLIRAEKDKPAVRKPISLKKILAPTDGSKESETSLPYVKDLASRLSAEVTFFNVLSNEINETPKTSKREGPSTARTKINKYLDKLVRDFQKSGVSARYEVADAKQGIGESINQYTTKNEMDLVIMATHGDAGPLRWILGKVSDKVLSEGNTPILLIRTLDTGKTKTS